MKLKNFLFQSYLPLFFAFCLISCVSCGSGNNQPDLSAVPHADALPTTELSTEDKAKLQEASGKTISQINDTELQNMLAASTEQLFVYVFWNSKCTGCLQSIRNLKQYNSSLSSDKMNIITINIGDNLKVANLTMRSENILFDSYHLKLTNNTWTKIIDEEWDGSIPAMFMVNKSEDLFLKYYKVMSENELEAILQTLII